MSYEIIWERHGVVKRFRGALGVAEYFRAHREMTQDARFDHRIRYVINDFTAVGSHSIASADLADYTAERIGSAYSFPDIRGALVAESPAMTEFCRLLVSPEHVTPHETRVFATLPEARQWLGC